MGWKEIFGFGSKKEDEEAPVADPLKDLTLANLQPGFFVDYDLKTWEVTAYNYYDWGHGDTTHEWQLKSHDETLYLQKESDDEDEWSVSRPIPFERLGPKIGEYIQENDDPPDEVVYDKTTYFLDTFGGGYFYRDGQGQGQEFLAWDYADESGERYLTVEQWGDEEFEASEGWPVESYQFTNILPRKR